MQCSIDTSIGFQNECNCNCSRMKQKCQHFNFDQKARVEVLKKKKSIKAF